MRSNFGHIQKLDKNRYRVFWSENHTRHSKTITGSLDDAELYLARREIETGGLLPASTTYSEYWQTAVVPTFAGLSDRTIYDYGRVWSVELEPRIGRERVSETNWRWAQAILNRIEAPSVQRHAYRTWKKVCNLAVRDGLLATNPIDRNIRLKPEQKNPKVTLTKKEVLSLLEQAKDYKHCYLIALEMGCGLRHEEACAITQPDIEFDGDYALVSVSKALTVVGGKVVRKDTKTAFSRRVVACSGVFRSIIENNYAKIPRKVSLQSSPVTISRNWLKYCERNGITHIPFGQMRTQFSVMHLQAGSLDSLVSLAMGHSDGTTRGRNYTVQTIQAMEMLADNLCAYFEKSE